MKFAKRSFPLFPLAACALLSTAAVGLAGWQPVGLQGSGVTALAMGRVFGDTLLAAGTASGVWYRFGQQAFQQLTDLPPAAPPSYIAGVHSLYLRDGSQRLLAGSDSGLAYYTFTSGLLPQWTRATDVPVAPVTDIIGTGDTVFCCTPMDVYRSADNGAHWAACSTRKSLPVLGNITSFTSLAFWCGIDAGSKFLGAMNSWEGVMNAGLDGKSWRDISMLPPQTQSIGQVFDLLAYTVDFTGWPRLLAATAGGLQFVEGDPDTGYWHPLSPKLEAMVPRSLAVTYRTRSTIADLFAAGDSGIFVLWGRGTGAWTKLLDKKSYCLAAYGRVDPNTWYAGTADGVWRYSVNASTARPESVARVPNGPLATGFFRLDGRIAPNRNELGIVINRTGIGDRVGHRSVVTP